MKKKDFTFSDGGTVRVHEVTSADLDAFQDQAKEAAESTYEDAGLSAFAMAYYPVLLACTESPPSLEESYKKSPDDIDNWFLLCCQLNQEWLGKTSYTQEDIKINGKKITVKSLRPSVGIRLATLEKEQTQEKQLSNEKDEAYRMGYWLLAASASFGNVPSAYQAKHDLGISEYKLWHETVRKLIPEWFGEVEATPAESVEKKKENKKPEE